MRPLRAVIVHTWGIILQKKKKIHSTVREGVPVVSADKDAAVAAHAKVRLHVKSNKPSGWGEEDKILHTEVI